jgi:hypothetical protein
MAAKSRLTTQAYLWLGISDATSEGMLLWTNGSTDTYSLWRTGESSGGSSENHVVIAENSNKWSDAMARIAAAGYLFERFDLDPLITDTDVDGINDRTEVEIHFSNPTVKDTDGDGFEDLFEFNTGFNPALATSTPDALSPIRTADEIRAF